MSVKSFITLAPGYLRRHFEGKPVRKYEAEISRQQVGRFPGLCAVLTIKCFLHPADLFNRHFLSLDDLTQPILTLAATIHYKSLTSFNFPTLVPNFVSLIRKLCSKFPIFILKFPTKLHKTNNNLILKNCYFLAFGRPDHKFQLGYAC
jgi:hypothetical protein